MDWTSVKSPLADILTLHARMERLKVVEKIKAAEIHLRASGLDPTPFSQVRRALLTSTVGVRAPIFPGDASPTPPTPPDGAKPLKHLRVQERSNG